MQHWTDTEWHNLNKEEITILSDNVFDDREVTIFIKESVMTTYLNTDIVVPIDADIFDENEIIVIIYPNIISIIDIFPNALLLEGLPLKEVVKVDKPTKKEDIWDILNNLNNSDTAEDVKPVRRKVCAGCGMADTLIENVQIGIIECSNCGLMSEALVDYGPEWRQYNNDDNRGEGINRCGCPSNFFFPKSSQGTIMVGINNNRLKRKQKWNSMIYRERSLNSVFEHMSEVCEKNGIPKIIIDKAKMLYKRLSECRHKTGANVGKQIIIRGENRLSIIAACVFNACEMCKNPRNIKEIAQYFGLDEKKVTKGNKQYIKFLRDDHNLTYYQDNDSAEDYIRRHCINLNIHKTNTDIAVRIAKNCYRMKLASDHNPQSIAAGSILAMADYCDLDIDKRDISQLFEISIITINKIYNKIMPCIDGVVDDDATDFLIKRFKING